MMVYQFVLVLPLAKIINNLFLYECRRVSGLMTNAPYMLNMDCDMFANNPQIVLHAMCMMLGFEHESDCVCSVPSYLL